MTAADAESASGSSRHAPQAWWQWWLMYPGLTIAVLGAIPTLLQGIQAIRIGSSFSNVPFAIRTAALFENNFDCLKQNGPTVVLNDNTKVESVICKTGDIWVRGTKANNQSGISWITPSDVLPDKSAALLAGEAYAAPLPPLAEAAAQVLCVFKESSGRIVRRVVVAPGKCQDEQIDPYTGHITVVPAACSCPR